LNNGQGALPARTEWQDLVDAYLSFKADVRHKEPATIKSARDTLSNFKRLVGPVPAHHMNQGAVNRFVKERSGEGTAPATINKDLRHLKAFVRWAIRYKHMGNEAREINWTDAFQTEEKHRVRSATMKELLRVLYSANTLYGQPWYLRLLLAISTGMRQQDIERLTVSDVRTQDATMKTLNKKAHKLSDSRPLHRLICGLLAEYIATLPEGQQQLWPDKYHRSKWERIKEHAGITERLTYHGFRASFVSFILQAGFSPYLTSQIYANLSPVYADAVNSVPMGRLHDAVQQAGRAATEEEAFKLLDRLARGGPAAKPERPAGDSEPTAP
jgi:integrase